MNNLLQVNLRYTDEKNQNASGIRNLKKGNNCSVEHINKLISELNSIVQYYDNLEIKVINDVLIDVCYNDLISKSRRIKAFLKKESRDVDDSIVGARFTDGNIEDEKHVITYYIDRNTINNSINNLRAVKEFLSLELNGVATSENFNITDEDKKGNLKYKNSQKLGKTIIRDLIVDCSVIENLNVPNNLTLEKKKNLLITLYSTENEYNDIFYKLNINYPTYSNYGDNTLSVDWNTYSSLVFGAPYLISMISSDLSKLPSFNTYNKQKETLLIPKPTNEPTIGVIDTLFDENAYFSEWVENKDYLSEFDKRDNGIYDRTHGTAVSSIIVDGPSLNPDLNDNCGRFKVRHFGVCEDTISIPSLVRKIKEIISNNSDIHVWNLSLGTPEEVSKNFVSYDASVLDEIQSSSNVIFVISGTNDDRNFKTSGMRIGSPADSLNSVVVNSVRRDGTPTSYTRNGPVLSFYNKPDVSYYGGDKNEKIKVYTPDGVCQLYGTSFAAPWISRKLCYMIDVLGLQKEIAKALIIDSAANWNYKKNGFKNVTAKGYGVVPIDINEIIKTKDSEIRFLLYGISKSYKTTNYSIPIPKDKDNKYPFITRATLCYFPECTRSQGVDYTNRELSIKFGRIDNNGKILDINENIQDIEGGFATERSSRNLFRKWDNTKFISTVIKNNIALKSYDNGNWGISITSKERKDSTIRKPLNFGIVVTLKEIKNKNRIQDFIKSFQLKGIIVNEVDIDLKNKIYLSNQEEIEFEE